MMEEKYKILAVDDNPINLKLLSRALINSDYEIHTASSGEEALRIARQVHPDLILLDVIMPGMSGYEVCKKLQENEQTAYIPVIFLSAKNEAVDKAKGLSLGAVDYLTKPFNPLEINARVRTHLSARRSTILLLRKNQELTETINELQKQLDKQIKGQKAINYLHKISSTTFHIVQDSIELYMASKSENLPVTTVHIPVFEGPELVVVLSLHGFEKEYPTLIVEHLVQKFVEGFFKGLATDALKVNESILTHLFNTLIDRFSPDIYQVAFTFSLSIFDLKQKQMYFYGLNQNTPFEISPGKEPDWIKGKAILIDSELRNFITAIRLPLHSEQRFVHYLSAQSDLNNTLYERVFIPALTQNQYDLQKSVLWLDDRLPAGKNDQAFLMVSVK
jgi:DNA-binding response OmpR family regulator